MTQKEQRDVHGKGSASGCNSETRAVGEKQDGGVSQDGGQKIQVSLADFCAAAAHHQQILQHSMKWGLSSHKKFTRERRKGMGSSEGSPTLF